MAIVVDVASSPRSVWEFSALAHLLQFFTAQGLGLWQRAQFMPQAGSLVAHIQIGEQSPARRGLHPGAAAEAPMPVLDAFAAAKAHVPTHSLTSFVNGDFSPKGRCGSSD